MNLKKMNKGLDFLRTKYGAAEGEITIKDGHCYVISSAGSAFAGSASVGSASAGSAFAGSAFAGSASVGSAFAGSASVGSARIAKSSADGCATPLLPGRMERKIVELKKMTENGTLEGVSTLRFAAFAPKGTDPKAMLAKELDLAAYLGAADVVRVMAVASQAGSAVAINVLAKLANDVNVSVEIGTGLPKGELGYDRHEIIAKRGVACDQTVDTHTPHASIRCWDQKGAVEFTDVDTELFGLTYEEIWNVRAAFALLQKRADAKIWKAAWAKATKAAELAFKADATKKAQTIAVKKGIDTNVAIKVAEVR